MNKMLKKEEPTTATNVENVSATAVPLPQTNMGPTVFFPGPIELAAGATSRVPLPSTNMGPMGLFPGTIELAAGATSTVPLRNMSARCVTATRFESEVGLHNLGSNCDFRHELEDQQMRIRNQQFQSQMVDQPGSSTLLPTLKRCVLGVSGEKTLFCMD